MFQEAANFTGNGLVFQLGARGNCTENYDYIICCSSEDRGP